jgi:sugar O-acyltransferase (sialic acid O-acetyltransferase NeuD family)
MARLVIFGAGDIARLAQFYFRTDSEHEVAAFVVDAEHRKSDTFQGLPLVETAAALERYSPAEYDMFVALSYAKMNRARAAKYEQMKTVGYRLVSYVSSRCTYLSETAPGDNCFILEDNTIQPFATIGSDVTLWSGNHIGHDSVIEDHCFITSHVVVSGHVRVRSYCFIGVNATLRNSIEIAPATLVGAGAVIMKNTREKGVYLPQRAELFEKTSDQVEL